MGYSIRQIPVDHKWYYDLSLEYFNRRFPQRVCKRRSAA